MHQVYPEDQIIAWRKEVHRKMNTTLDPDFTSFSTSDLQKLFKLYDNLFFGGQIARKLKEENTTLSMKVTHRGGITYGGKCIRTHRGKKCFYTLKFPTSVFRGLFTGSEKSLLTGGLLCRDRLECLQITFEHELIHLLMNLWGYRERKKGIYSSHGKLFQCMLYAYFGHTEFRHSLFAGEASEILRKSDVYVGMKVRVKGAKGGPGIITSINPKTVGVKYIYQGELAHARVPLALLERTEEEVKFPSHLKRSQARVGMKVKFTVKGKEHSGIIIRRNPKTASIRETTPRGTFKWLIPWSFLKS